MKPGDPSPARQRSFLGPRTSPVVDRTINKKYSVITSKSAKIWAFINLCLALLMIYEM